MRFDERSMEYTDKDISAQVLWDKEKQGHVLQWTDGINEWSRDYESLGLALIALGSILHSPYNDVDDVVQVVRDHHAATTGE